MKIIHCSDIHFESKLNELPTEKKRVRREEMLSTFTKMVEYASENWVSAIIIAGDMFDVKTVSVKTKARIVSLMKEYPNIDFFILKGNHDDGFSDCPSDTDNIKFFGDEWTYFNYENVTVAGTVLTSSNSRFIADSVKLDEKRKNIVVLHGQVAGYKSNEEAEIISLPKFAEKNIDYLALGHIHSFEQGKLDNRGIYVYSGCLEGRGFDETGEKGFVLLNIDNDTITHEFIPFASRKVVVKEYEVQADKDWYTNEKIIINSLENESETSIVKVELKGEITAELNIDEENLTRKLNDKFFYAKVNNKTKLKVNLTDFANDKTLRGEFVREVLNSSLTEEQKEAVILKGLNALKGEI